MSDITLSSMLATPKFLDKPLTTAGFLFESERPYLNFLRLIHVDPETTESISATYQKHQIPGRNLPVFAFSGMEGRSISVTLHFFAQWCPLLEVQRKVSWLKTLYYPRDQANTTVPPPKVILALGAYILVKGVMTSFSATHKPPFGGLNTVAGMVSMLPHYATVDFTIDETENFFTGNLPDYETAEAEASLGLSALGVPSYVLAPLNLF